MSVCLSDRQMSLVYLFRARGQWSAPKQPQRIPQAATRHSPSSATRLTLRRFLVGNTIFPAENRKHFFRLEIGLSPSSEQQAKMNFGGMGRLELFSPPKTRCQNFDLRWLNSNFDDFFVTNRIEPAQLDVLKFCRGVEIRLESLSALPHARASSLTPDWRVRAEAPSPPRARMYKYYKKLRTLTCFMVVQHKRQRPQRLTSRFRQVRERDRFWSTSLPGRAAARVCVGCL